MKTGLTISSVAHAGLLLWGMVTFAAEPFTMGPQESLPVDIVSDTDFTKLAAGIRTATQAPEPKPLVEKQGENKPATEQAKVVDKPEVVATKSEQTPPAPEQKKTESKPEKSEKSEPKADPIAEALKKEEQKDKAEAQTEKTPLPPKKPRPPKFDPAKIAALLDKRDAQRRTATGDIVNSTPTLGVSASNALTLSQSEIDALRAQIQACWNPPVGVLDAPDLIVQIRLQLNRDGSLTTDPMLLNRGSNTLFQVAADSALRAIRRCQPYKLPIAKYQVWKDVEVTFDPRDMFRG